MVSTSAATLALALKDYYSSCAWWWEVESEGLLRKLLLPAVVVLIKDSKGSPLQVTRAGARVRLGTP